MELPGMMVDWRCRCHSGLGWRAGGASGHRSEDTMKTERKKLDDVSDYKLATLAYYFGLEK